MSQRDQFAIQCYCALLGVSRYEMRDPSIGQVGTPTFRVLAQRAVDCADALQDALDQPRKVQVSFAPVVEKCPDTGLYSGHVPGVDGLHTQGETLRELQDNLQEVAQLIVDEARATNGGDASPVDAKWKMKSAPDRPAGSIASP